MTCPQVNVILGKRAGGFADLLLMFGPFCHFFKIRLSPHSVITFVPSVCRLADFTYHLLFKISSVGVHIKVVSIVDYSLIQEVFHEISSSENHQLSTSC